MQTRSDPIYHFFIHTLIAAQVQASECLSLPQQRDYILDCRAYQPSCLEIQVIQLEVVLDEVFETHYYLLVERSQLNLSLPSDYLLCGQLRLLLLKQ